MISVAALPWTERDPVPVLVLDYRPQPMSFRDPGKVSWIQCPDGNGTAVDDDSVLAHFDDLAGESHNPFEEPLFQSRMVAQAQQNEVSTFWQSTPKQSDLGVRQLHFVGGSVHDNLIAKQNSRYI